MKVDRDWPALIPFTRLQRGLPHQVGQREEEGHLKLWLPGLALGLWTHEGLQGHSEVASACLEKMVLCVTLGIPKVNSWATVLAHS